MSEDVKYFDDSSFDSGIEQGVTLVDFYADWCGPCKMIAQIIAQLATEMKGKATIAKVDVENAGKVADDDFNDWYRELFAPSITAGLLKPADLAGYRNQQVYIGGSKHTPLNNDAVRDAMPVLFELLQEEPDAAVRAVLGHFVFVFIHPYIDGNGRMGRFLMNAMLASGGYPWTVIPVEERKTYMAALERASVDHNIKPFAEFVAHLVKEGLKGHPVATL